MSGVTRSLALKHFQRVVSRWPKDPLRPDRQLQDVLTKRLESGNFAPGTEALGETAKQEANLRQANAAFGLLDNRYKSRHRISPHLLKPTSNPDYYTALLREIDEAPKRSWIDRMAKKFGGMIRLS
ncbi:hypothetical protein GQ53DRAFT_819872 [Thozetella sp. PMI_491]|nr:hypothetical protein GQ53DRAFT_819872 [Thozetella sp. PMI_491]